MRVLVAKHTLQVKISTCIPSPYQVELFDALSLRDDISITVIYLRTVTSHLFSTKLRNCHRYRVLAGARVGPDRGHSLSPGLVREVLRRDYDVFVVSGRDPRSIASMILLSLLRRPWIYWGERPHPIRLGSTKARLRRGFAWILERASWGVLGIGERAVQDYHNLGVSRQRIHNVPYSPNLDRLVHPSEDDLKGATKFRMQVTNGSDGVVFLFCGSLIHRKGVDCLLDAFSVAANEEPNIRLVIVGDGPDRASLAARVPARHGNRVAFAGAAKDRADLYCAYLAADVFVFPSRYDGWGVVINEALGAGLPVVTTNAVGAAMDMIEEGRNGYIVPVDDAQEIGRRMVQLATDDELRGDMARRARLTALRYDSRAGAARMAQALRTLCGG